MKNQRGVSLIEVMVAVIVFSVGLLGLAAMQVNSIRFNESASVRGHAVFLAYEMADRMRANPAAKADPSGYAMSFGGAPGCAMSALDSCAVHARDKAEWSDALTRQLPSGEGAVMVNGNLVTITVRWDEGRVGGSQAQTVSIVTRI